MTALAVRHTPETHMFASADPEEPDGVDLCRICWTPWPCLIADLADMPGARPKPIDWSTFGALSEEVPPF